MRLIDADELKKAIIKHLCVKSENNLFPSEKSIYNCIDEQPTIEQPKWILISERKPNSCGTYIVTRWSFDDSDRRLLTDACYFDGTSEWHDDTRVNFGREFVTDKVVAWMPMPEPIKEYEPTTEELLEAFAEDG